MRHAPKDQLQVSQTDYMTQPGITVKNGSVCRMIDFAPGGVSPMHRVESLDYAIVIEGVFRMVLDSGEERIMQRGDVAIQRTTSHRWINVTGNGLLPARILFVLLDVKDVNVAGNKVDGFLGVLGKDYVGLPGHEKAAVEMNGVDNGFYQSEF
jgi:quercetin dioxygenase-like cupin family protein